MTADDWPQVLAIYLEGLATGDATFETEAPEFAKWDFAHLQHSRLVVREGENVLGWAALSPISERCVYGGVAEVSIYVAAATRGKGVGATLLDALIISSENNGIWTLQAGIFPENVASIRLHLSAGFREIGRRERVGYVNNKWRDAVLVERRSIVVGLD